MRSRRWSEEGFSLVEVMFAAFLAFFMLTATFGLVVSSARQGRSANVQSIATNLGNLLIEQARSMTYLDIGTSGAVSPEISGALASSETTTYQGVSFEITRSVTWVDDPVNDTTSTTNATDYKHVTISVAWASGSMAFETYVRDRSNEQGGIPTVVFDNTVVPAANSVIFNPTGLNQAYIWSGDAYDPNGTNGLVWLKASANTTGTAGMLTRLQFWISGANGAQMPLLNDYATPLPSPAYWSLAEASFTTPGTPGYPVDSQTMDDSSTPVWPDGVRTVKVQVWSASGSTDFKTRDLVVDNYAPLWPSAVASRAISVTTPTANQDRYQTLMPMRFGVAMDGTDACRKYRMRIDRIGDALGIRDYPSAPNYVDLGSNGTYVLGTGAPSGLTLYPLNLYGIHIHLWSPRGMSYGSGNGNGYDRVNNDSGYAYLWSSVRLDGDGVRNGSKSNVTLRYSVPFPATTCTYYIYESSSFTPGVELGSLIATTTASTFTTNSVNPPMYFQVEARLGAVAGVAAMAKRSNVALVAGSATASLTIP